MFGSVSQPASLGARVVGAQDVNFVESVHLLQEDERENGVRTQAEVVGREALPQLEEAFLSSHLVDDVDCTGVLRLARDRLHILNPKINIARVLLSLHVTFTLRFIIRGEHGYLVLAMSTGIDAAVVTNPEIMLAKK